MCPENYQGPSLLDFTQHKLCFRGFSGGSVFGMVEQVSCINCSPTSSRRNSRRPVPCERLKLSLAHKYWVHSWLFRELLLTEKIIILPCFILWNSQRLFCTLSDTTYPLQDYTNFTHVQPLCIPRSIHIPAYC